MSRTFDLILKGGDVVNTGTGLLYGDIGVGIGGEAVDPGETEPTHARAAADPRSAARRC